jgi:ABC-type transport system substrate-binding protein
MAYPDRALPAGFRLTPSLAEGKPRVSKDGRTYTFTIRKRARFSTGAAVTARAFAHELERELDPDMESGAAGSWLDISGAQAFNEGNATTITGLAAKGRTLTLRLTGRVPDLTERFTQLCAVPPNLPTDPEGARAPLHSPAPYYVSEYVPGERVVLERNRFYKGERPQHVARFVADLDVDQGAATNLVASGTFDAMVPSFVQDRTAELAKRYRVNRSRFFVLPGAGIRLFHLNTSRPLFRKNPKLRQAVNFAVDRRTLARAGGFLVETPTDQHLTPGTPGYRDERIYPLKGPDLRAARRLAKGRTRDRTAILYTTDTAVDVAQAQVLQQNLRQIGIEVEINDVPAPILFEKLAEPWDIFRVRWGASRDPSFVGCLFDGRTIGQATSCNNSNFDSPKFNRLIDNASRLSGDARERAYGELDVQISRDAAPAIPVAVFNSLVFVSARAGCVVMNPNLDLTAVCLK